MNNKKSKKASTPVVQITSPDEKRKALESAVGRIKKEYGDGTIMTLKDNTDMSVSAVSTGSLTLDLALGIGGLPRGRIVEIFGPESSGKTTVALHVVAEVQKTGGIAAFIDAEHALDPIYAHALGVNIDDFLVSQPDSGEQALDITESLVRSGAVDVVVVDSVAALTPQAEIDGDMGASHVGLQARLMSQALRKLSSIVARSNSIIIFINQLREKVGISYGNPETTPGGRALKFYSSVRIDIRKSETLKTGEDAFGNKTKCKVVKNKVAPPFKRAEFDIMYGKGISKIGEIIDIAVDLDLIHKSGSWFSYEGNRLGQGKENVRVYFETNKEICDEIEEKIRANSDKIDLSANEVDIDDGGDGEEDFEVSADIGGDDE